MDDHQGVSKSKGSCSKNNGSTTGKDGELRKRAMRQINVAAEEDDHQQGISKSKSSCNNNNGNGNGNGSKGKDGSSKLRKRAMMRRIDVAEEDVNELADDFINNFRNQLKFEREESLKRFHEMIDRGG